MKIINQITKRTPLGWLQLNKEKSRLVVALAGIAFADILMFMQLGFRGALFDSNTAFIRKMDADIILASPKAKNSQNFSTFSRRRLYQALDIQGVTEAKPLYSAILTWNNPQTGLKSFVQLVGFDPDQQLFNIPELNQQLEKVKMPQTVIFDRRSRGKYNQVIARVEQGETVVTEAEGKSVKIAGLFSLGASFGTDGFLMTSSQNFQLIFPKKKPGNVSLGLLKIEPGSDLILIKETLKAYLPNDVEVFTMEEFIQKELNFWNQESPVGFIFGLGALMAFVVGVVIVYQVLSTDVNAHLHEYATFKAMGYRQRYLLLIVFEEALILAVLGFFPGVLVSLGLYRVAAKATSLPLILRFSRISFVFILTLIMCLLSGAIATRKLEKADPADMF
jgi:putative ABC transport system permease protein